MWFVILVVLGDNKMAKDNLPKLPPLEDVLGAVTGKSGTSKKNASGDLLKIIQNLSPADKKKLAKILNLAENKSYVEVPALIEKYCAKGGCDIQLVFSEGEKGIVCRHYIEDNVGYGNFMLCGIDRHEENGGYCAFVKSWLGYI